MIEEAILAALRASLGNSDALKALARIELHLSQPQSARSPIGLSELVNRWSQTLDGVAHVDRERLKRQLREITAFPESSSPRLE
jgi:hypothetical protein